MARVAARTAPKTEIETTPETDGEWLDTMVKRLFKTLENQLSEIGKAHPGAKDAAARAANARTLSSLERTLERLAKLERERLSVRQKKVAKHGLPEDARAALERRMDKLLAQVEAQGVARKPE